MQETGTGSPQYGVNTLTGTKRRGSFFKFLSHFNGFKVVILNVVMNVTKYFDKSSKKRHISVDLNQEKERKKIRDGSYASSTDNCDVFEVDLKSPECKEIFNCFKNLQEKVTEINNLGHDTRNM